jgi:hypothetical protein
MAIAYYEAADAHGAYCRNIPARPDKFCEHVGKAVTSTTEWERRVLGRQLRIA